MTGDFYDAYNTSLSDAEAAFGEAFTLIRTGETWPTIGIDRDSATSRAMSGGIYVDTQTLVVISLQVFLDSGVKKGDILTTSRGSARFAVKEIDDDGDAARTLLCGPAQVATFR